MTTTNSDLSTFSIVGRCNRTGQLGVAVATANIGAGRLVTWAKPKVGAVATQARVNTYIAADALTMMERGDSAPKAIETLLGSDPGRDRRQVGAVDSNGLSGAWTGALCVPWCGHLTGQDFSAQGNMLVGPETVKALATVFSSRSDEDLAERLLSALEAAEKAGGDKRGRQCSALYVVETNEYALWDLRVEDHPDPIGELRRIFEISKVELLPYVQAMPTRSNPLDRLSEDFSRMESLPPPLRPGRGGSAPGEVSETSAEPPAMSSQ